MSRLLSKLGWRRSRSEHRYPVPPGNLYGPSRPFPPLPPNDTNPPILFPGHGYGLHPSLYPVPYNAYPVVRDSPSQGSVYPYQSGPGLGFGADPAEEIVVAVMGATGSGKSTFISRVTGRQDIAIGHNLTSETNQCTPYHFEAQGFRFCLVDTPGFNDTYLEEDEILAQLASFMETSYRANVKLSAILYLHPITHHKLEGSALDNLTMFRQLCGSEFYPRVVLATSFWDQVSPHVGARREDELKSTDEFWGTMVRRGSEVIRLPDNSQDCVRLLLRLTGRGTGVLQIQRELVDQDMHISQTQAGQGLRNAEAVAALEKSFQGQIQLFNMQRQEAEAVRRARAEEESARHEMQLLRQAMEEEQVRRDTEARLRVKELERQVKIKEKEKHLREVQRERELLDQQMQEIEQRRHREREAEHEKQSRRKEQWRRLERQRAEELQRLQEEELEMEREEERQRRREERRKRRDKEERQRRKEEEQRRQEKEEERRQERKRQRKEELERQRRTQTQVDVPRGVLAIGERGYVIEAGENGFWRTRNVPSDLSEYLNKNVDKIYSVAIGEGQNFFCAWRDHKGKNYYHDHLPNYPLLKEYLNPKHMKPSDKFDYATFNVALGPNGSFYLNNSKSGQYRNNIDLRLDAEIDRCRTNKGCWDGNPAYVTLGIDGSYVLVKKDGGLHWDLKGHYDGLGDILRNAAKRGVINIKLSPFNGDQYWVKSKGYSWWRKPNEWDWKMYSLALLASLLEWLPPQELLQKAKTAKLRFASLMYETFPPKRP